MTDRHRDHDPRAHAVDSHLDSHLDADLDADPTGIRALLRGLPDPGPMPEDVIARIRDSLAAECGTGATTFADPAQPKPAPPEPAPPGHRQPGDPRPRSESAEVTSLETHRARRSARSRYLPWAAAAGLVAVAGGGLIASGGTGSLTADFSAGGSDSATSADSAPLAARQGAADTSADAEGSAHSGAAGAPAAPAAATTIVMTNTAWSEQNLTTSVRATLEAAQTAGLRPLASESPAIGPIGTSIGGRDCASSLGVPTGDTVVIDLGTYARSPAALVVARSAGGEQTAYVVSRSCRLGAPGLISGPHAG